MAKFTVSRLFELSQYLQTKAGEELQGALVYLSDFVDVVARSLKNGLSFEDNFDSQVKTVSITPDTETVVLDAGQKRVKQILVRRVVDATYFRVASFGWKYTGSGEVAIKVGFDDAPPATQIINVELILLFS